MLTVHHLSDSQSERIVWLCEELELDYALVRYEREPSKAAPPAYKALHPAGTAPVITDDDLVLAETGAIVDYLLQVYDDDARLALGPGDPGFADYLFWLHFANGSMVPAFMMDVVAMRLGQPNGGPRTDRAFALVEQRLGAAPWFAGGRFTAADVMMLFPLTAATRSMGRDLSGLPNATAYLARAKARPAYRAAMAKAEPASFASA